MTVLWLAVAAVLLGGGVTLSRRNYPGPACVALIGAIISIAFSALSGR